MTTRVSRIAIAAGVLLMGPAACVDLTVPNLNEPDRERALGSGLDVEALIAGTFHTWWDLQQGRTPGPALAAAADEISPAVGNYGYFDMGVEPRQPIVNIIGYLSNYHVIDPWQFLYRSLAAIRDALLSIEDGVDIGPAGTDNHRAITFARFMQGLAHAQIAVLYHRGLVIDETVEEVRAVEILDYPEVMAAARAYFAEARHLAAQTPFTIPSSWMGGGPYTNEDLLRLSHSYEARLMTQVARTPEERQAVNWDEVLDHIAAGVTTDFGVEIEGPGGRWTHTFKNITSGATVNLEMALVGMADQSGGWQAYEATEPREKLPFVVDTDDLRIGTPTRQGTLAEYRPNLTGDPARGTWFLSYYSPHHYRELADHNRGFAVDLSMEEMDYIRAEALIRLGRIQEALPIINENRVEEGGLPPVTEHGVVGQDRCVPRTWRGECGDLLYTLQYEKKLHLMLLSQGSGYYDARGFGTLREGTAIHFPIPTQDLQAMGIESYSLGGVGGTDSAPPWP